MTGTAPFPIAKAEASWIERSKGWAARKGIVYLTDLTRPLGTFNVPFTRYTVASRFSDVQEIMARAHRLPVPYDERSRDAGWGKSFLLAHTQMDHAYWSVRNAVRNSGQPTIVLCCRTCSTDCVRASSGTPSPTAGT